MFEERYDVTNHTNVVRPWIEVIDQSELPAQTGSRVISWIGRKEQRSYSTYTFLSRRGCIRLGPTILRSGDPFGIFSNQRSSDARQSLLVLPYFVDLGYFLSPIGLLPGGKAQQFRTTEVTPHAAGVREYSPGDSLNRIHWASSAKRQKLMVKEFERDPQSDLWVFMDAQKGLHGRLAYMPPEQLADQLFFLKKQKSIELPPDSFEYAVSICASVCRYFIRTGQAVGLYANNKNLLSIQPERGERQLGKILEALAYLEPDGSQNFQNLIEAHRGHIPRGSSVVIITPSIDDELIRGIAMLTLRDMYPVVVLVDQNAFGGTYDINGALARLESNNIPVAVIKQTNNLKEAIEDGFVFIPDSYQYGINKQYHPGIWEKN
ncbi:MAG: DUF58 domain-containing protein [Anaerolineae bacterium]|nr:DUF58 domain-containing protein [Anaerolineae bacterium]